MFVYRPVRSKEAKVASRPAFSLRRRKTSNHDITCASSADNLPARSPLYQESLQYEYEDFDHIPSMLIANYDHLSPSDDDCVVVVEHHRPSRLSVVVDSIDQPMSDTSFQAASSVHRRASEPDTKEHQLKTISETDDESSASNAAPAKPPRPIGGSSGPVRCTKQMQSMYAMQASTSNGNQSNANMKRSTEYATAFTCRSAAFDQADLVTDDCGHILGGSLPALIKRLTPTRDYCPDRHYIFTFLLNARLFVPPQDLLHDMLQQCMFTVGADSDNFKRESRTRFFKNILKLCNEWTALFPYDFVSDLSMQRLKELLSLCSQDPTAQHNCTTLMTNLRDKLNRLERYEHALEDIRSKTANHLLPSEHNTGILTVCDRASTVAQQLTHIELERLAMIGPEEFVYSLVHEAQGCSNHIIKNLPLNFERCKSRTHNVQYYVDWFNRLAALVSTDIVKHTKKRHRAKLLEFYIDVAQECFNIGNFNSMMAIVNGLSSPAVVRLKRSRHKINTQKLEILKHQLDPSGNFTTYRATLKAAIWRAELDVAKNSSNIVIPFFTLLIKDLLAVHQKCVDRLPNGHVNYSMFAAFAEQLHNFEQWKNSTCQFPKHSDTLNYLLVAQIFDEKSVQLASFECEAPDNDCDKELYKKLRHELQWPR